MTDMSAAMAKGGGPAPVLRLFGWGMLAILAAYLIENVCVVWFGFDGASAALSGGGLAMAALYIAAVALCAFWVLSSGSTPLRRDAARITAFNAYLVRSLFWAVFFVGIVDAGIAFVRAEGFLTLFMDNETAILYGQSRFLAPTFHAPLIALGFVVGLFTRTLGFTWLTLLIVAAELGIVFSRFIFSYEQALMGDLVRYWYAALFLFASAYTLLEEGHVRVDVLYAGFSQRAKGRANAVGAILFGMTSCWIIIVIGFASRTSVINSPISSFEISQTGATGMYVKYQMAAFLGVFAVTMLIQFVSQLFEAVADIRGEPGRREVASASAQ